VNVRGSKKIKYLHLICIAAILFIGRGSAMAAESREIKLGFAIAQSGWMTDYDKSATQAALLEIEEINAGGGILGSKLVPKAFMKQTATAATPRLFRRRATRRASSSSSG
jgi:ABC-type branched-subunit amino acid transport system substrate-binding protein